MSKKIILTEIQKEYNFKTKQQFADALGLKPQTISSWYSRKTFDHDLLYEKLENLNPEFLFTGEGPVKIKSNTLNVSKKIEQQYDQTNSFPLITDHNMENQSVPLYDIELSNTILPLLQVITSQQPVDYIMIPNLPKLNNEVYAVVKFI